MTVPEAAAVALCILARLSPNLHERCPYCTKTKQELVDMLRDYGVWFDPKDDYVERRRLHITPEVKAEEAEYRRLTMREREQRLKAAQAMPATEWYQEIAG